MKQQIYKQLFTFHEGLSGSIGNKEIYDAIISFLKTSVRKDPARDTKIVVQSILMAVDKVIKEDPSFAQDYEKRFWENLEIQSKGVYKYQLPESKMREMAQDHIYIEDNRSTILELTKSGGIWNVDEYKRNNILQKAIGVRSKTISDTQLDDVTKYAQGIGLYVQYGL